MLISLISGPRQEKYGQGHRQKEKEGHQKGKGKGKERTRSFMGSLRRVSLISVGVLEDIEDKVWWWRFRWWSWWRFSGVYSSSADLITFCFEVGESGIFHTYFVA